MIARVCLSVVATVPRRSWSKWSTWLILWASWCCWTWFTATPPRTQRTASTSSMGPTPVSSILHPEESTVSGTAASSTTPGIRAVNTETAAQLLLCIHLHISRSHLAQLQGFGDPSGFDSQTYKYLTGHYPQVTNSTWPYRPFPSSYNMFKSINHHWMLYSDIYLALDKCRNMPGFVF